MCLRDLGRLPGGGGYCAGSQTVRRGKALDAVGVKMQRAQWDPESSVKRERACGENEIKGQGWYPTRSPGEGIREESWGGGELI